MQELRDFWIRYYVPNNATLVIAGAVKHAEAQQLAKRHFGWIPRGSDPPRVKIEEPPLGARSITIKEDNAPAPVVGVLFRTVPLGHPDSVPLSLLERIVVGDDSSRLHRALVVDKKVAVQAINISQSLEQDGLFFAGAVVVPFGGKPDVTMKALDEQIARLRNEPITEHELTKARNQELKAAVTQTLTIEGKASALARAAVLEGNPARVNDGLADIRRVTVADLERVARTYLRPDRQVNVTIPANMSAGKSKTNPEEDAAITGEAEKVAPPPGRPGASRPQGFFPTAPLAAAIEVDPTPIPHSTSTLPNGLKVIVVPNPEVPFVSVTLGLYAGAWTDVKPGTASMTLDLITKGTKQHDEPQLAEELGTYAISLSGSGAMDSSTVTTNCLTDQLERAMKLFGEVVRAPTFPEDQYDDVRKQTLTSLRISARDPGYVARRELRRKMFGEHPYARSATGETKDVEALKLSDLPDWWQKFARPDMAVLIFAGDITEERARQLAESTFGDWKAAGEKPDPKLAAPPKPSDTHIYLVDRPDTTQSQIQVGQLGYTRHDPRYATGRVVNGYFGGAFSSRLNETIRVKRGLTYGANGGFKTQRFAGEFNVSTFSKTETTADALAAVFEEIERLKTEPPSADELRKSKAFLIGNFPLDRETPFQMASELWSLELYGLPGDFYEKDLRNIAKTNEAGCMSLVTEAVHGKQLDVVVLGNAAEIKEALEKIAPVTVIEAKE